MSHLPSPLILLPGGGRGPSSASFDEAEFFAGKSMRGRGQMESVTFKMHEGYVAEVDKWWRSRKVKQYDVMSDLLRHAVVRHLRWLPTVEGEIEGSLLNELAQIDEVVGRWKFHNIFVKHIESIAEQVNFTLGLPNGRLEVERMLREMRRRITLTRPSFYKTVYEKMFSDRFGPYLTRIVLLDGGGNELSVNDESGGECDERNNSNSDPSIGMLEYELDEVEEDNR